MIADMQDQNKNVMAVMTSLLETMTELSEENKCIKQRLADIEASSKQENKFVMERLKEIEALSRQESRLIQESLMEIGAFSKQENKLIKVSLAEMEAFVRLQSNDIMRRLMKIEASHIQQNESINDQLTEIEANTKQRFFPEEIPRVDDQLMGTDHQTMIEKVMQDELLKKTLNPKAVSTANIDKVRDKLNEVETQQVFSAVQQIQQCNERIESICSGVDPEFIKFGRRKRQA